LELTQKPGQVLSDGVVQAAMLFEHSCSIAFRDLVDVHENLDQGSIQSAQSVEKIVDLAGSDAARTHLSPGLFTQLRHWVASLD
jgi:hypothetical protein